MLVFNMGSNGTDTNLWNISGTASWRLEIEWQSVSVPVEKISDSGSSCSSVLASAMPASDMTIMAVFIYFYR